MHREQNKERPQGSRTVLPCCDLAAGVDFLILVYATIFYARVKSFPGAGGAEPLAARANGRSSMGAIHRALYNQRVSRLNVKSAGQTTFLTH